MEYLLQTAEKSLHHTVGNNLEQSKLLNFYSGQVLKPCNFWKLNFGPRGVPALPLGVAVERSVHFSLLMLLLSSLS
jgi:hypothetical protein